MMNMHNPFALDGKYIFVTGASSGIGRSVAIECSKLGAIVFITGRNRERLEETFSLLHGANHQLCVADLNDEGQRNEMIDLLPMLNGIVLASGIVNSIPFQNVREDKLYDIFNSNFFSPVLLLRGILKKKKIQKPSSAVFLSSIDGPVTVHPANSVYAASKGAISAMVKGMAVDLSSKGIRVNAILPGMIETPLIRKGDITDEQLEKDKNLYPLKRYGTPEEVAYAAIYLLSDASTFTTGTNLIVDGGFTLL